MWGVIGKLFGSTEVINKGIDTLANGLDKLIYTDEEKEQAAMKERAEARSMVIGWMESTRGQNLARRLLALVITGVWLFMYALSAVMDISVVWVSPELASQVAKSADLIGGRATQMNGAMMLILGFYFAAPHIGNIIPAAMERFSKKS